jgi:hypothetical protein
MTRADAKITTGMASFSMEPIGHVSSRRTGAIDGPPVLDITAYMIEFAPRHPGAPARPVGQAHERRLIGRGQECPACE